MGRLLEAISNMFGGIAMATADSFSWIGLYEPEKPKQLRK